MSTADAGTTAIAAEPAAMASHTPGPVPARALVVAGTPLASWLDAAEPWRRTAARTMRHPDAVERWFDDVVGTGARALARQTAWSDGKGLSFTDAQRQSLSRLAADGPSTVIDARACWALDDLDSAHPGMRCLLFVDHPARALAAWLARREGDDPQAVLRVWEAGARRLLRHAHRHRSTCLLIDADEARREPEALVDACRRLVGWEVDALAPASAPGPGSSEGPAADPLAWALAEALLAAQPSARDLYEELRAASTALAKDATPPRSLRWSSRLDAGAAAGRWRQLEAAARDADRLTQLATERALHLQTALGQHEQARAESQRLNLQLETALGQHEQARAALAATEAREQQARAEAQRLGLRLQQLQEELNHQFDAGQAAQQLAAERAQQLELAHDGQRRQAELATKRRVQVEQLGRRLDEQSRLATRRATELDRTQAELQSLEGSRTHAIAALIGYDVADSSFGAERTQPLFAAGDRPPPVAAWHASGREGSRSFMLLVPSDPAAQIRLGAMGTTDWGLVLGVASTLVQTLQRADPALQSRWLAVAQQLLAQLHDLPERLRYDGVRTARAAEDPARALDATFERVVAGSRVLPALDIRWWPMARAAGPGRAGALAILAPAERSGPPLLDAWAVDDGGAWAASAVLPLGGDVGRKARVQAWAQLGDHDRGIAIALLDALPAVVRAAADADLPAGTTKPALASAARQLRLQARLLVAGATWRRWARRLRGRLSRR